MSFVKTVAKKAGVDKAIAYSSGARIVQSVAGVGIIFFISRFLTGVEQGFYFTFGSIIALQIFFELGLTGIITQFVAHEAAHLKLNEDGTYAGEEYYKSRLSSLLRFCVKWYGIISAVVFVFLLIVGFVFFSSYTDAESGEVSWKIPWILLCIGTALKLFQSPFNSFIMGIGKVKEMSKVSFWQQTLMPLSCCVGLVCNFKLYVLSISAFVSVIVWMVFVCRTELWSILANLWRIPITDRVLYLKEIFPYQWRIALSWVSGYFIFQLFNPVLFATDGPVVAGQMGLTLQVLSGIQAFALSWLNTKVPLYSSLISLKDYTKLDRIFNKTLIQMSSICLGLLVAAFAILFGLKESGLKFGDSVLGDRFLDYWPTLFMMIPLFANQFVNSWATYLRCHKKEPYLIPSVVMGLLCCCSTVGLGHLYGVWGITVGYTALTIIVSIPWCYWIYKTKKKEWHTDGIDAEH